MANCQFCGRPAGLFRSKHIQCEEEQKKRERLAEAGRQRIVREISRAIRDSESLDGLEETLIEIERSSFVPSSDRKALLITGWEASVEQSLEDGLLDTTEERRLVEFKERFALSQSELDQNGALTKTAKAAVLRDVFGGVVRINFKKASELSGLFRVRNTWRTRHGASLLDAPRG